MSDHVLGDEGLGNMNAELQEFTVNSRRTPKRIVPADRADQFSCRLRNAWSSEVSMANLPGPVPAKTAAMPGDDGLGFDDQ